MYSILKEYYEAVLNDKNNDDVFELDDINLSVIFLTPNQKNKGLEEEFSNLNINNKSWLYWNSEDQDEKTIVNLIQNILKQEQEAFISPINEYMRHTLKAFAHYIINTININNGKNRVGIDLGELKRQEEIKINNEIYTLTLRDSGQIQLYNKDGDKVIARPLLVDFLKDNNIQSTKSQNTRILGKIILDHIDQQHTGENKLIM